MTSSGRPPSKTPFVDRAREEALKRLTAAGEDTGSLSLFDQTILAVSSAQGVIDNGGFGSFFGADWPGQPPYSFFSDAYRRIGAEGAAESIDQAVALFPFGHPERNQDRRERFMRGLPPTHDLLLLGDRLCGDATVWARLEEYARKQSGH